jgi:hypothetical protein
VNHRIIVKRSTIVIENYNLGDCNKLERSFSIFDKVYFKYTFKGIYYDAENYKLYLPRGVNIGWLEKLLDVQAYIEEDFDPIDQISPVMIKYLPRDKVQKTALDFILGNGDYLANRFKPQLSVNLNTGKGKTYVSIAASSFLLYRTIMITSNLDWINQWKDCILEYTDTKPEEIYIIAGSSSIEKLKRGMHDISKIKYILASHATIQSYATKNGWPAVGELFKFFRVGFKIYDEAHLYFDNICMIDFFTNTYKSVYLTATPARSDRNENNIYQKSLRAMPKIDLFDENEDPHTQYISIQYNSHPSPYELNHCATGYGFSMIKYAEYIINKPIFYKMLYIIVDMCLKMDGKILIYIGKIDSIMQVYNWMIQAFPFLDGNIGIYNSSIPKELKDAQLENKFILTTTKSCGAAMDIKGLKATVLLAEPFGSEVLARQTLGRTRAENTTYIEVVDIGFNAIRNYYFKKLKIFKKYATKCSNIMLNDHLIEEKYNELYWNYNTKILEFLEEKKKDLPKVFYHVK